MATIIKSVVGVPASEIDQLRARRQGLATRLAAAEVALADKEAAAQELAAAADDDRALEQAVGDITAAERLIVAMRGGLAKIDAEIGRIEAEIAAQEAERERDAAATEIDELRLELEAVAPTAVAAVGRAAVLLEKARGVGFELGQLAGFLNSLGPELDHSFASSVHLLQSASDHVRSGARELVKFRDPVAQQPAPVSTTEPVNKVVLLLEDVVFTANGQRQRRCRHHRHSLPQHVAEAAIKANFAVEPTAEVARRIEAAGPRFYEPSRDDLCRDLDALASATASSA